MRSGFLVLLLTAVFCTTALAEIRDGRMFDPGITFTQPAESAPEALAELSGFTGDWDIELEIYQPDQEPLRSSGIAKVTYMNRGHGLMERSRIADFDGAGNTMSTMAFIAVDGNGVWTFSEANSWNESITVYSGEFQDNRLTLDNSIRPGGSTSLLLLRRTLSKTGDNSYVMLSESSSDFGTSWQNSSRRTFTRRAADESFFSLRDDTGLPAPDRADEAAQFDFLLGEFQATHWLPQPQGILRWRSNATATFVLDGHAILEFDWYDSNPNQADTATSILRIYNRSMRRWESLYLPNRNNVPLYFGGVQEADRIVLHPFDAQTGSNQLFQWIFFDVRDDAYRWKGLQSSDRGNSWSPHWAIEFQRKGTAHPDPLTAAPQQVQTTAADGTQVFGDHYRSTQTAAPTVVLFHQAGSDARGEHSNTARRLVQEGYEVFAWDARSGGDRLGNTNRTVAALGESTDDYCAAYPDLEAALKYAFLQGSGGPIFAVGSSYSAALVIRLAAQHGNRLAGVAAFSPASSRMGDCEVVDWLPTAEATPKLVFRPASEMEFPPVAEQAEMLNSQGIEVFVAPDSVHGASMLNPDRNQGNVDATWTRLLAFFADPAPAAD